MATILYSVKKNILVNSAYLLLSDVGVRMLSVFATIFLARYLGPEAFGLYIVAFSLSFVFGFMTDMGLTHTYLRESTREDANSDALAIGFLKVKLFLAAVASALAWLVVTLFYAQEPLRTMAFIVVIPSIWGVALINFGVAYFSAIQQMKYVALIRSIMTLVHASYLLLGISLNVSLFTLSLSPGLSSLTAGLVGLLLVSRRISCFRIGEVSGLLPGVTMFALLGLINITLPQLGPLVLEKVTTVNEVGLFAALYRIPLVLAIVPVAITSAYYPQQFKYANSDREKHLSLSLKGFRIIPALLVGLTLPFALYGGWIVNVVFGKGWTECSSLLAILAWLVVVQGASRPLSNYLLTLGHQARQAAVLSIAIITGILFYMYLGARFGALGGVWSAVIIELVVLTGNLTCCPDAKLFVKQGAFVTARILMCMLAPLMIKFVLQPDSQGIGVVMVPISFYLLLICSDREFRQDVKWLFNIKNWAS